MKTNSIFFSLMIGAAAFTFSNCGGNKKESHDDHAPAATAESADGSPAVPEPGAPQFAVDATFQQQLSGVFNSYITLKEAFVSSDPARVSSGAGATRTALNTTDMKLLSGAAHNDWMIYLEGMESSLKTMESSSDIEVQREAFSTLSENLYKSIKAFGLGGATAFYEFCPMAFNNQGASWLSDVEEIRNPYFGNKMLTCGSVTEKLQ